MVSFINKIKRKAYGALFNRSPLGEILTAFYSFYLHLIYSFRDDRPGVEKKRLEYYLVKHCHIVEKGLSLPSPRKAFGQPKIKTLIKRVGEYEKLYGNDDIGLMVRDTLRQYISFHSDDLGVLPEDFLQILEKFIEEKPFRNKGGLKRLVKAEIPNLGVVPFEEFLKSRHSIRNFSKKPVETSVLIKAISIARNTPSVCNRQGWLVHCYQDKHKISELLSFQNGNAGFGDSIDKLLIVTASVKAFTRHEHNQLFIDGGLYSMNLMLALHAVGLGSCPLNTCMPWLKENQLKKQAGIEKHERLIMMIAVGNLLDKFDVAQSEKYPVEKILRQHL